MVQPQNISSAVDEFLSLLQLNPYQQFVLEQNDPGTHSYSSCMLSCPVDPLAILSPVVDKVHFQCATVHQSLS